MQNTNATYPVSESLPGGGWAISPEQYDDLIHLAVKGTMQLSSDAGQQIMLKRIKGHSPRGTCFCLKRIPRTEASEGRYILAPVTAEDIEKRPDIKLFQISEPISNKKLFFLAGSTLATAATIIGIIASPKGEKTSDTLSQSGNSALHHHIIGNPIPNIQLYENITIRAGQNIGQLAGEYHVSMSQLFAMNPQLNTLGKDWFLTQDTTIFIPKAQDVFVLTEGTTWNTIGEKYGISPHVLTRINGFNVRIGDTIIIPTAEQARDIMNYLDGEDIVLQTITVASDITLAEIARLNDIPRHLYELYIELNCSNPDKSDPKAIISDNQILKPGAKVVMPTVRDMSKELSTQTTLSRPRYDMHKVTPEDKIDSIMKWFGLTAEEFQNLNPTIPLNSKLKVDTYVRIRDTSQILAGVQAQITLPEEVIAFVKSLELGAAKEGYLREGLSQKTEDGAFKFPKDAITLEPGMDLGQIESTIFEYALSAVLPAEIVDRFMQLEKVVKKYKTESKVALKTIPEAFADLRGFRLTEAQTNAVKKRVLQAYWDNFLIKKAPHLNHPDIPHEIKEALLSVIYQRGGYFFTTRGHEEALESIKKGDWHNPALLAAIQDGQKGTESRTQKEVEHFLLGLQKIGLARTK